MYIFVSDLDGTLLDEGHKLNSIERKMILDIQNKNHKFVVATGRHISNILPIFKGLSNISFIAMNGSCVFDFDSKLIYEKPIEDDDLNKAFKIIKDNNITSVFNLKDKIYTNNIFNHFKIMMNLHNTSFFTKLDLFLKAKSFKKYNKEKIYKIELDYESAKHVDFTILTNVSIVKSDIYIEITHKDANKKDAVINLLKENNYNQEDVVCFGDSGNDLEMLKHFKNSYLMENAEEYLHKQILNKTSSNLNHGVYNIIKGYLDK